MHQAAFAGHRLSAKLAPNPNPSIRIERQTFGLAFRGHGDRMATATQDKIALPDMKVSIRQLFGFDSDMEVPAYSKADEHVPDIDPDYRFDKPTTLAILAG